MQNTILVISVLKGKEKKAQGMQEFKKFKYFLSKDPPISMVGNVPRDTQTHYKGKKLLLPPTVFTKGNKTKIEPYVNRLYDLSCLPRFMSLNINLQFFCV